jgi:hypothetical protein
MIEFLQSLRSDLFSRRLLPFVALAAVALIAAVAYAVTGGSGSSAPAPVASLPSISVTGSAPALPVTVAPTNPNEAVSETPSGMRFQSQGPTRDPFIPLPAPPVTKAATSSSSPSSSSSSSSSTGSGSGGSSSSGSGGSTSKGSGGGQEAPAPAPKKTSKPKFPYVVSVLFGPASTTPGQPATLAPYEDIKPGDLFPSNQNPRISFERVTNNGAGAVFKLVSPPILHGTGICLPSTSECQTIDLEPGHSEELEYIEANGQIVVYELKVVSIVKGNGASAASLKHKDAGAARVRRKAHSK